MKPKLLPFLFILLIITISGCTQQDQSTIDLSGQWRFQMDPQDKGIAEKWYNENLNELVSLPGSMVENGKGYDISVDTKWTGGIRDREWYNNPNYKPYVDTSIIRFPYWLQPLKKYTGAAWYLKKVDLPQEWLGKTVQLVLERPHWESTVWINGNEVETHNSLAVPHVFDISSYLKTGTNTIAVRIDNRLDKVDPGRDSHSVSDHTQSNWNGIVGDMKLQATDRISFKNIKVFPDPENKEIEIIAVVDNFLDEKRDVKISAEAILRNTGGKTKKTSWEFSLEPGENTVKMAYQLGPDALLWDEFNPNVYQLSLALKSEKEQDIDYVDFGLRKVYVKDKKFIVNGRPIFLRGTLECAIFPKTGYPPTDHKGWEKVFKAVKAHGLNHVRFHSWCPPEAAFQVADSMGIYFQVECSSWANGSTRIGSGLPIDQYVWDESKRIVDAYGNHPSFLMMAYGNEPGGPKHQEYLAKFVSYWKEKDKRRVYTAGAGWPALPENEYQNEHTHKGKGVRIQGWGEGLKSIINSQPPRSDYDFDEAIQDLDVPMVSHEIGQWCVYPNFKEIPKYDGVLKPKNFEIFRESLEAHGMLQLADSFLLASGKLQALCYKADIEAALRTKGFGGFQLLDLHDFPGQGTALVGVLDPFWEEKGYITPEEYSRFCNETVPLARFKKRIFTSDEAIDVELEIAHFGPKELSGVTTSWKIFNNDGKVVKEGTLMPVDLNWGNGIPLGSISENIVVEKASKFRLEVEVADFKNGWDLWVYPSELPKTYDDILIVRKLDKKAITALQEGKNVLLTIEKGSIKEGKGGEVGIGFSSIFWNTAWTGEQKPHTLGILCDPEHPALAEFPTEYYSNWQWWDAMSHSNAVNIEGFSSTVTPIVRVIDDWVTNRNLALLFEAKVGKGKLLFSGIDLQSDLETRPEARQLLYSLKSHMSGDGFNPQVSLSIDEIKSLLK
ncbi:sugar-binding domain-containing protein [Maribellus sediminis]|uniref:sugar-binding domain-containing protein n=1 Tax=Maribellus sediminis TaxID=2696285 RepID=UPI0014321B11|nr:sugar-binding domain-containing protein [Maribellus sediminis]